MIQRLRLFWEKGQVRLWFWMGFAASIFNAFYNSVGASDLLGFVYGFCAWFVASSLFIVVVSGSLWAAALLSDWLPHGRIRWILVPLLFLGALGLSALAFPKLMKPVPYIGWRVDAMWRSFGEQDD